jgi:hypoxanthine phosphoribosyltransferase
MNPTVKIAGKSFTLVIAPEAITTKVRDLAEQLNRDFEKCNPVFLGVLNGAFMFASDLVKNIKIDCQVSFIRLSSYTGTASSGKVKDLTGVPENISGRNVIILDDIAETGTTLHHLINKVSALNPLSVKTAVLLVKPSALKIPVSIDYSCFNIQNDFVVGYGLDYNGYGRNLEGIYKEAV